jgi:hypothetical protein
MMMMMRRTGSFIILLGLFICILAPGNTTSSSQHRKNCVRRVWCGVLNLLVRSNVTIIDPYLDFSNPHPSRPYSYFILQDHTSCKNHNWMKHLILYVMDYKNDSL